MYKRQALCCEGVKGANVLTVAVDDEQAAFDAVAALIKKGHKRIGFIGTNSSAISSTARENGYIRALKEYGIEIKNEYIYKESYDYDCGGRAFEYFNALAEKPTAIFAVSDLLAISAMHKAIDMGIDVGKDVAKLYSAIGKPASSEYASSCIGNGEDGLLYYDGFTVTTYRENGKETVQDAY